MSSSTLPISGACQFTCARAGYCANRDAGSANPPLGSMGWYMLGSMATACWATMLCMFCCILCSCQARCLSIISSSSRGLIHIRPASDRKCLPRASARANRLPHPHCPPALRSPLHTNFFSPECKPSCRFLSCWRANALPQTVQTKGRSSVCVRKCDRRLYALVNLLGHKVHWNVAGCFCTRFEFPLSWAAWYSGSANLRAITLFGTADMDCRRRDAALALPDRSPGDNDAGDTEREESEPDRLRARSTPRCGDKLPGVVGLEMFAPPLL